MPQPPTTCVAWWPSAVDSSLAAVRGTGKTTLLNALLGLWNRPGASSFWRTPRSSPPEHEQVVALRT